MYTDLWKKVIRCILDSQKGPEQRLYSGLGSDANRKGGEVATGFAKFMIKGGKRCVKDSPSLLLAKSMISSWKVIVYYFPHP
jgi:hypothetical protein